nr:family 43 glycosylhydrolase [Chitinophaga ginsengisegetis]
MYYYLYTLSGHEHYEYAYGYSRQSPLGPYTWPEQDIILITDKEAKIYGPGHGNVFHEPGTDNYYFIYLEFGNGGTTRQIWVDKMEFNEDGTIRQVKLTAWSLLQMAGSGRHAEVTKTASCNHHIQIISPEK